MDLADPMRCERCGRCCYQKLIIDGEVVYTPFPCHYLDEESRLCRVYERRHEVNPCCITVAMGVRLGVFPPDCPYVRDLPDYVPPRMALTPEEAAACAGLLAEVENAAPGEEDEEGKAEG